MVNKLSIEKGTPLAKVLQNWEKIYDTAYLSKKHAVACARRNGHILLGKLVGAPGKFGQPMEHSIKTHLFTTPLTG